MSSVEDPDPLLLQHRAIQEEQIRVYSVTDGLKSKHTKIAYNIAFNHFLKTTVKSDDLRALLDIKQSVIESKIIDHVKYLKDVEKLKYRSILVHLQAIFHFFEINDYNNNNLKRRKIRRFLPEDESDHYARDRPYSIKDIEQILSGCDIRARVAVLLMASTGMRIGGLRELEFGDIRKIDEFGIYLIWVYNRSGKYRYYTFCPPECAAVIDEYLEYRKRSGEQLKDKSPLIRDKYGIDNPFTPPAKFLSIRAMSSIFENVLKKTGINQPTISKPKWQKREVMCSHGFRKFFINQCIKAGLTESAWKPLVGHKLPD